MTRPRITTLALAVAAIGVVVASTLVFTQGSYEGAIAQDGERAGMSPPHAMSAPDGSPLEPAIWIPLPERATGQPMSPLELAIAEGKGGLELEIAASGVNPYPRTYIPRMKAIGQLPESFHVEVSEHPNFAGIYIDDDVVLVIRATGNLDDFQAIFDRYAAPDRIFVVREAEYTQAELELWQARVGADMDDLRSDGILITQAGVDPISNRLLIKVSDLTDQKASLLVDRYGGPRVKVVPGVLYHFNADLPPPDITAPPVALPAGLTSPSGPR